ncbi:MAG TPA: DUF3307 domain-containing protein [Anaerolineae bacterium]|nr:DUF3307 domain-containing protein [Anaerolineae bacterium]
MIIAMLLAHLMGDYVLQWDTLARWKGTAVKGAACHGLIVSAVTLLFAMLIDPAWWPWALLIGLAHIAIDCSWVMFNRRFAPNNGMYGLVRLLIDQSLHFAVIAFALFASGYVTPTACPASSGIGLPGAIVCEVQTHRLWAIALGYVLISMPTWIFIEFIFYGLINGSAPDFSRVGKYKYVGSLERGLIATFVATGQFTLVPVVALPRLVLESPQYFGSNHSTLYIAEWLGSLAVAVLIGLALGRM